MVLLARLLSKAIAEPRSILLCWWAFKRLWMVDRCLKEMAIAALKMPVDIEPTSFDLELTTEIQQRVRAIAWTAKIHPLRPKCLHRSVVLHQWLQKRGINAQLEIGWGKDIGHAWVTYNNVVLNDRADIAEVTPRLIKVTEVATNEPAIKTLI